MFGQLLNKPVIWEKSPGGLDVSFGLYQRRFNVMHTWHVLDNNPDVLDIGCGIGQYSQITTGRYLGLDLNNRYIAYASRRHPIPNKSFRCQDVASVLDTRQRFDLV